MGDAQGALTLAIETSNPSSGGEPGVALGLTTRLGVRLLDHEPLGTGDRHDDLLMPAIERLFARSERDHAKLERVAVSIGPGGYTGLRIATAAASLIGLTTGAMVLGVPSAWVASRRVPVGEPFAVCLASKRDGAWVHRFEADRTPIGTGSLVPIDAIAGVETRVWVADRFLPEAARSEIAARGGRVIEPEFEASSVLELAWSVSPSVNGVVHPLYGREAEAVTRWRELHG